MNQYKKEPLFDKNTVTKLSTNLKLKESQIYKWNWDQRKRDGLIVAKEKKIKNSEM